MLKNNPIISFLKKHILLEKKSIFLLLGISLISSSIVVVQPLLMQKLIDEAFIPKDIDALYTWGILILILGVIGIAISSFNQYRYTSLSTKLLFNFRTDIFEMIFFQQKTFFQKYKTGDLLSRLEGDIAEIQRFATDSIFSITTAILGMIGALSIMYMFDPILASFCLILLPIEFLILKPLYPKMGEKTMAIRESTAFLGSFMIESLKHTLFFKTSNNINSRIKDLQELQSHNRSKILDQQKLQIIFSQIPIIISLIGRAFLVFWGGIRVVNGQIEIGEFIAFLTYFGMILGPVQTLLGVLNNIPKVKVSLERLSILVPKLEEESSFKNIGIHPNITFENVSFKYTPNSEIFNNMNIEIPYGQKITLLGENGIGKTTFLELLLNLLKPNKGTIKLSNTSIHKIKPSVLYNLIGIVEQHPIILGTSLANNLRITKEDANTVELMEVIEKVGLRSWFNKLAHGLDTQLSESGQSLSGGQRQRIAIARLLLQKPDIVLLDEHTSSLDYETSIIIENLIDELFKDSTRIIITHKQEYSNSLLYKIQNKKLILIKGDTNV